MTKSKTILLILLTLTFSFALIAEDTRDTTAVPMWKRDPCFTSSLFSATAHTVPTGQTNFRDVELLWLSYAHGFSDGFQGALGFMFPISSELLIISPSLKLNVFRNSGESVVISLKGEYTRIKDFGLFSADIFGSFHPHERHGFHLRIGRVFPKDSEESVLTYSFAWHIASSKSTKLISEIVRFVDEDGDALTMLFLGIRLFGERMSGDIGGFRPLNNSSSSLILIPYLAFTYRF